MLFRNDHCWGKLLREKLLQSKPKNNLFREGLLLPIITRQPSFIQDLHHNDGMYGQLRRHLVLRGNAVLSIAAALVLDFGNYDLNSSGSIATTTHDLLEKIRKQTLNEI